MPSNTPAVRWSPLFKPLSPQKVLEWLREKALVTDPDELAMLGEEAYRLAWSVASVTELSVLESLREGLQTVISEGGTVRDWLGMLDELAAETGWSTTDGHAQTIFRTTLASAYESDRYNELTGSEFVDYLVYTAIHDDRVRAEHLALDGMAWPREQFPDEYWPPIDYNCRCSVIPADAADLQTLGAKVQEEPIARDENGDPIQAADGFRSAPNIPELTTEVDSLLQQRLRDWGWTRA